MNWAESYRELLDYVRNHPEIHIDNAVTVIPEFYRPAFFQRFDRVRLAFLDDYFPGVPEEIRLLKMVLDEVQEVIKARLHLRSILIGKPVSQFLENPFQELMRDLFDPLFLLLKQEMDLETWKNQAMAVIKENYSRLFKSAYIRWIVLALIKRLQPSACYRVEVPRLEISAREPVTPLEPREIPHPQPSHEISFPKEAVPSFIVPQAIVHSTLAGRYISFRSDLDFTLPITRVLWTASEYDRSRQWISLDGFRKPLGLQFCLMIQSHVSLKYAGLIADAARIARPQLILEFEGPYESMSDICDKIALYRNYLQPIKGIFLVRSKTDPYGGPPCDPEVKPISAGLNEARLQPVVEALLETPGACLSNN